MKKKNQTSHTNRYILLGLSLFCALMMVLSSFSEQAAGPFKVLANITVIPLQQGINHVGEMAGGYERQFLDDAAAPGVKMRTCRPRSMRLRRKTTIFRKRDTSMSVCRNCISWTRIMRNTRRRRLM